MFSKRIVAAMPALTKFSITIGSLALAAPAFGFSERDVEEEFRPETPNVISTEGIAYCGQQDLEAACSPMFYRTDNGQVFRVVNSPALVEALGDGKMNLRVSMTGDVVLSTLFAADRLRIDDFTILQRLKGGVHDVAGKLAPSTTEDDPTAHDHG